MQSAHGGGTAVRSSLPMRQCASDQRHRTLLCAPPCPLLRESEFAQDSAGFGQTKFVETTRRGKTREWVQSVRLWPARMPICAAAVHSGLKHARENRGKAAGKKRQAQERVWLEAEATDCYAPERARTHTAQCARIAPADTRTARTPTRAHPRPPCTCRRRSRSMRPFSRSWRGRTG